MALLHQLIPNKRNRRRKKRSGNADWLPYVLLLLLGLLIVAVRRFA
jgi:hypothetical protein